MLLSTFGRRGQRVIAWKTMMGSLINSSDLHANGASWVESNLFRKVLSVSGLPSMAKKPFFLLYILLVASFLICCHCLEERKVIVFLFPFFQNVLTRSFFLIYWPSCVQVHIVYMGEKPKGGVAVKSMHHSILEDVLGRSLQLDWLVVVINNPCC